MLAAASRENVIDLYRVVLKSNFLVTIFSNVIDLFRVELNSIFVITILSKYEWASRAKVIDLYKRVQQGDGDEDSGDRAYAHAATCKGHSGAVAFVDWDESGEWLQSVDTSYEILFWRVGDAGGGKELRPHTVLADVQKVLWHTMTCPVSFAGVGVMGASGAEVKGIDRDPERSMLIAANAKNELSLYRYPAVEGVECTTSGSAHCAMVTNVRFLCDGKRAVSIGGKDLSCMVWDLISPG